MLGKYYYSIKQLTPTQIWGRISYMTRRKTLHRSERYLSQFRNGSNEGKPFQPLPFDVDEHHADRLGELAKGSFTFLNQQATLSANQNAANTGSLQINWQPTNVTQLWAYNLHYFDYTMALAQQFVLNQRDEAYTVFRDLANSWIDSCPPPMAVAWDPYPTSLRVSNWIKAYTYFGSKLNDDEQFAERLRSSLYAQLKFLADHLEYHVMGNHLIENGRALLIGGLFFQDKQAKRWRKKGWQILSKELDKQFLTDGANYERSPMYHQIMLGLYAEALTLIERVEKQTTEQVTVQVTKQIVEPTQLAHVRSRVADMRTWLAAMLHPDNQIALYNDSAFGIAPPPAVQLASQPDAQKKKVDGLDPWPESGYFAFRDQRAQNLLLCDYGPFGADDQPGHAHCDAGSYELSLGGERMIVDSGVGCYYGESGWRDYYRSTRAHNTVVVDGEEQSEIWSRFRVARRADALNVCWQGDDPTLSYVIGSHTGYQRLAGAVEHRRWICWVDQRFWIICDRLSGEGTHVAESLLHFHPEVTIQKAPKWINGYAAKASGIAQRGTSKLQILPWGLDNMKSYCGETDPIQGWYAPEFGKDIKNRAWGFVREGRLPFWFGYILWPDATSEIHGKQDVSVTGLADGANSCQIKVTTEAKIHTIQCNEFDVLHM